MKFAEKMSNQPFPIIANRSRPFKVRQNTPFPFNYYTTLPCASLKYLGFSIHTGIQNLISWRLTTTHTPYFQFYNPVKPFPYLRGTNQKLT